jgi:hypothetical protein
MDRNDGYGHPDAQVVVVVLVHWSVAATLPLALNGS